MIARIWQGRIRSAQCTSPKMTAISPNRSERRTCGTTRCMAETWNGCHLCMQLATSAVAKRRNVYFSVVMEEMKRENLFLDSDRHFGHSVACDAGIRPIRKVAGSGQPPF